VLLGQGPVLRVLLGQECKLGVLLGQVRMLGMLLHCTLILIARSTPDICFFTEGSIKWVVT